MSLDQVQRLLTKVYRGVGTARAKRLEGLAARGEWAILQKERVEKPSKYGSADAYMRDAIVVDLMRKCLLPGDESSRKAEAVKAFWASEAQCASTNSRLDRFIHNGPFDGPQDVRVADFISRWRKEFGSVVGSLPQRLTPRFSGGSTLSDKGMLTTIPDKMSSQPTAYPHMLDVYRHSVEGIDVFNWLPSIVRGNRFFTVSKDSETDRGCCVEPSAAVSLQLDVARHMRKGYMRRYAVDLTLMQQVHRKLACSASTGEIRSVTIDLKRASDTVARVLIQLLADDSWYDLLSCLSARFTELDGAWVRLEKFSSMGNGFTFELETIVFRTLLATLGCHDDETFVFGDDIIVHERHAQDVIAALKFFGFEVNSSKTFCEGPFRESCGGDYFEGQAVRPHFLKKPPDEPQEWMALANGLRRADPQLRYLRAAWRFCIDQVPKRLRVFGPSHLGDTVFHDPAAQPTMLIQDGEEKPFWFSYGPVQRGYDLEQYWQPPVVLKAAVLGVNRNVVPRDSISGYKLRKVLAYGLADPLKAISIFEKRRPLKKWLILS